MSDCFLAKWIIDDSCLIAIVFFHCLDDKSGEPNSIFWLNVISVYILFFLIIEESRLLFGYVGPVLNLSNWPTRPPTK